MKARVFFYDGEDYSTGEFWSLREAIGEGFVEVDENEIKPTDECSIINQFTGLKDRNGKEIYDGDIVEVSIRETYLSDDNEKMQTGKMVAKYWSVEMVNHMTLCGPCFYGSNRRFNIAATKSSIFNNNAQVVGNIHENPELLSDKQ